MRDFVGKVTSKTFGRGSKSEHRAVMLETSDGNFKLRLAGGNPFEDPRLTRLVGETIRCKGQIDDYTLTITEWKKIGGGDKK